jgi:uncharacterized membrane protein YkoI
MLSRNALVVFIATALTAAVAGAQQPAKPATPARSTVAPAQPPAARKPAQTSTLAVSADSAKKIVAAHAAGATVTSTRLRRNDGKAYYAVSYRMKGATKTMHATVDANTGAFDTTTAPAAPAKSPAKPSAKKPS